MYDFINLNFLDNNYISHADSLESLLHYQSPYISSLKFLENTLYNCFANHRSAPPKLCVLLVLLEGEDEVDLTFLILQMAEKFCDK